MQALTHESLTRIAAARAEHYDHHYRTAGWKAEPWTKEKIEGFLAYAVDADEGGYLNGKEVQYALRVLGAPDCRGMKVLDYCCGTGITAIYFALCGARVWAFDASSEAIGMAERSSEMSGVSERIHFGVLDAQSLPYPDSFFDASFCQSALHILIDYPDCPHELARVLQPGAQAIFCDEGLGYNPLLKPVRWLRRRKWIDHGGRPLTYPDIERFAEPFSQVDIQHFNLLTQVKTVFGRQLHRHGRLQPWTRRLLRMTETADRLMLSAMPCLKRYCGAVVVTFTR